MPVWVAESDRVTFDVKAKVSRPHAALERVKERDGKKKPVHGRYYSIEPRVMDGGEWPTLQDWITDLAEKAGRSENRTRKAP